MESAILTPKRTDYGKSIRKAYESGEIKESRHNMTELEPRKDRMSNTPTTVQKDNLLLEVKERNTEVKVIGQMDNSIDHTFESANRVYDTDGLSPTMNTCGDGGLQPKIIVKNKQPMIIDDTQGFEDEPRIYKNVSPCLRSERTGLKTIVAMRGRNPDNPSDRTVGSPTEQRLEPNSQGICNTLTSVQKDNMVLEPKLVGGIGEKWGDKQYRQGNRVYDSESVAMALTAQPIGNTGENSYMYLTRELQYRIRKLTPRECGRLMSVSDDDISKMLSVNSNSQCYKEFGNSIVVNVLKAIFGQMIPGKEDVYKEI